MTREHKRYLDAGRAEMNDEDSNLNPAQRADHDTLLKAWTDASELLLRAKEVGAFGGPAMIAIRKRAVTEAKQRLDDWEAANNWNA